MSKKYYLLAAAALVIAGGLLIQRYHQEDMSVDAGPGDAGLKEYSFEIKNHRFIPDEIHVKAGEKIRLKISNLDNDIEEVEVEDLHIERMVFLGKPIEMVIGPLYKGEYEIEGEFHPSTAKGEIVVE